VGGLASFLGWVGGVREVRKVSRIDSTLNNSRKVSQIEGVVTFGGGGQELALS
jgi:hypothetical protein